MDRTYDEKNLLYFCKRASSSVFLLAILAFLMWSVGFSREEGGWIWMVIAVIFAAMAVWTLLKPNFIKVDGKYIDESADKLMQRTQLLKNALEALNLDEEDLENLESMVITGYTVSPIKTEPLFRWDEEDQTARSSNYQMTLFLLDETIMFTYTQVHSLVDSEYADGSHIWRYAAITDCHLSKVVRRCVINPRKQEEKTEARFNEMTITGENGERYIYAFTEDQRENAELLQDVILERAAKRARMRKANIKKSGDIHISEDVKALLSKQEKKSVDIGIIGDDLKDL